MIGANRKQAPGLSASPGGAQPGNKALIIRDATSEDMPAIQRIYARHVLQGTATFEEVPPTLEEMVTRRTHVLAAGMPYLVAVVDGAIAGYCYASQYRPRVAYRYTIEDSIYLAEGQSGKGLGKALLTALIERCEQGPWRQMVAVIAGTNNLSSIGLHRSLGFSHVGTQPATGFKFNQWIDVVFMQRALGPGNTEPPISY